MRSDETRIKESMALFDLERYSEATSIMHVEGGEKKHRDKEARICLNEGVLEFKTAMMMRGRDENDITGSPCKNSID